MRSGLPTGTWNGEALTMLWVRSPISMLDCGTSVLGRRGGLLQGSFVLEVSLALVGVASPAYFQY